MRDVSAPRAIGMLAEILGRKDLAPDAMFGSLGLDSLQSAEWLTMIEDELEIEFDLRQIDYYAFSEKSVGDVLASLYEYAATVGGGPRG